MVQLEISKSQILTAEYELDEIGKGLRGAKELVQGFIEERRKAIDGMNVGDLDELKRYIEEAKQLKKL